MNKSVIIKIVGLAVVSLLVLTVATYFLYPYLNQAKYEQVVTEFQAKSEENRSGLRDSTDIQLDDIEIDSLSTEKILPDSAALVQLVDSLRTVNEELNQRLDAYLQQDFLATVSTFVSQANEAKEKKEPFADRIKSLLNLDEDQLKPIVNKLTNDQLVRLYNGSSNIQRAKLLRSLDPDLAAELMTEIML